MTKPLSLDLRQRIIRAVEEEGMSRRATATRYGVAPSTVVELLRQWEETGSCASLAQGGDKRSARIEEHSAEILALVEARPDITLAEIADHLLDAHGKRFVPSATIHALMETDRSARTATKRNVMMSIAANPPFAIRLASSAEAVNTGIHGVKR